MPRSTSRLATALLVALLVTPSLAHGPAPTEWPIERIVANLERRLKTAPDDTSAHYNLGRAHAFAFALKRSRLWIYGSDESPVFVDGLEYQDRRERPSQANDPALHGPPPDPAERLVHLREGVQHLRRSCELEPAQGQFHLTLAWLLEIGAEFGASLDPALVFGPPAAPLASERSEAIRGWIVDLGSPKPDVASRAERALSSPETLERAAPQLFSEKDSIDAKRQEAVRDLLRRSWTERAIGETARIVDHADDARARVQDAGRARDAECRRPLRPRRRRGRRALAMARA